MRTAEEIYNPIMKEWQNSDKLLKDIFIAAINEARKEAIEECAERAKIIYNGDCYDCDHEIDKQSILSLINELK